MLHLVAPPGPCQFPTLGFIVYRYLENQSFVSEDFWSIAVSHQKDEVVANFDWSKTRLSDSEEAEEVLAKCKVKPEATVTEIEVKDTEKR